MSSYREVNVVCRNCNQVSEQCLLVSTNNLFDGPDLDLRPAEMQRSTMDHWLCLCPHCGFCAPRLDKSKADRAVIESPEYRATLADARFPHTARRFLAHALLIGDSDLDALAYAYLCAAWDCDDAGFDALAVECRLRSAQVMERRKPFFDSRRGVSKGTVLVDVLRRAGQFERAAAECAVMQGMRKAQGIVKKVLEFEARLIAAGDSGTYTVEEAGKA